MALLGAQIANARAERRWTARELADRAGISVTTLRSAERGEPTVGVGVMFELATLVGVPLFAEDRAQLDSMLDLERHRAALLPRRVRPSKDIDDDF
ncbi:MAG: XRE family transcriptional regulator [Actinobacteria bacterium]|nr:XRE family transcriptional regulator [Actinomycetota bacterium]